LSGAHNGIVKTAARLYCLLSPGSSQGVVFRRGPSSQVLLIQWNLGDDSFAVGQWLKGRVYERRCDLSPDGKLLVYFAADFRRSVGSWTAISRPPYFTALALWPKGDCWGGGGLFASDTRLKVNHRSDQISLDPSFSVPKWLSVDSCGDWSGCGEDDPIWSSRLVRDGWKQTAWSEKTKDDRGAEIWIEYHPPIKWKKAHPLWPKRYTLQMSVLGIKARNGPWILTEHSVHGDRGYAGTIGQSEWADWSREGDLLFAQSGCLYRLRAEKGRLGPIKESEIIADFNDLAFRALEPPDEARIWPARSLKVRRKARRR
jgi:hypothetical protein